MTYTYSELKQAIQDYTENDETTFVNNLNNFIKNLFMHEQAGTRHAVLALQEECRAYGTNLDGFEVCIGEYHDRRFTAQFQGDFFQVA